MTNDKGNQFLLRVTEAHVQKALCSNWPGPHGCETCPAANALLDVGLYAPYVIAVQTITAWGYVEDKANTMVNIKSDSLHKAIRDFDETNEFETGVYLCEVV